METNGDIVKRRLLVKSGCLVKQGLAVEKSVQVVPRVTREGQMQAPIDRQKNGIRKKLYVRFSHGKNRKERGTDTSDGKKRLK